MKNSMHQLAITSPYPYPSICESIIAANMFQSGLRPLRSPVAACRLGMSDIDIAWELVSSVQKNDLKRLELLIMVCAGGACA